jgi:hypothetical protein
MRISIFVLFSAILAIGSGYKILAIFPFGSVSHYAIGEATMKAIAGAGHEVTMISAMKTKKPLENFREMTVKDPATELLKGLIESIEVLNRKLKVSSNFRSEVQRFHVCENNAIDIH